MHQMKLFHSFVKILNKILNSFFIFIIKGYRLLISPILPPSCRHIPTCSSYALQAYTKYPFFEATFLSLRRILKCNPFFKGGYDPLPENFTFFKLKKLNKN